MSKQVIYDYIICGGGGAGLSLAHRFCYNGFDHLKILVIDKDIKKSNDRTWCSWMKEKDRYSALACKKWDTVTFSSPRFTKDLHADPYHYRMIRGEDFYKHILNDIENTDHVHILTDEIISVIEVGELVEVKTSRGSHFAKLVFKSYSDVIVNKEKYLHLDQHFKGWMIETNERFFDPHKCLLMDFTIDQRDELRFMYVLPISERKALVEVAIFSDTLLQNDEYDSILKEYIRENLKLVDYTIEETEWGVIPMNNYPYFRDDTAKIIHIGTAVGAVKPSTGYAFSRIQRHCDAIIDCIYMGEDLSKAKHVFKPRFRFYDSIFLKVLMNKKGKGYQVMEDLFSFNDVSSVFDFLDEDTSIWDELKVMWACNKLDFIKALFQRLIHA